MFKLVEERRTWQKVTFPGLTEEGERIDNQIEMQFVLLGSDALVTLMEEAGAITVKAEPEKDDKTLSATMAEFGVKIIRDWKGVAEANEDPIKFSEESLARFFNVPGTFEATLSTYRDAVRGGKDARAGN
ncbi:hypothetical protein QQS45_00015 [Alteriqipengyuania flavescens]|uniref:hypothetical protein n=1 Tax=Alteriqipengyuania flavescens TaxID=3053610 RepID=UPI0025B58DE9|nr:hypothetical protein [Alteriqipengyuania flavescens]WJY18674.1 hypothetical protein QQW98_00015 [Alteriqipengyuania flavescens]WJY24614.1 hypothetical protein QQS45_00015 [Alteriqipengyuania flavescens]